MTISKQMKFGLLEKEDMENTKQVPAWVTEEYSTFKSIVTDPTFPCYFGMKAENKGELRYAYITHDDWSHLPSVLDRKSVV